MRYLGYGVRVPASWPVYDLTRQPLTCARFDRHAVYLGPVSPRQRCPAHAAGRTEALLLEPLTADAAGAGAVGAAGAGLVTGPDSIHLVPGHGRVVLTATWNQRPGVIERALRVDGLQDPAATAVAAAADGQPASASADGGAGLPSARTGAGLASARARTQTKTPGLGFDACATPSRAALSAWRASPYRTVGIYLGGANMACAQPNLNPSWVTAETAAGWSLIPTYVGLQAPTSTCGCARMAPGKAAAQGAAAAIDAVARARAVGLGAGNPIYYDMEAYTTGAGASRAVLAFLSAWTSSLHQAGYLSGVYSSAASGIRDLVAARGSATVEPDELWIANWNGKHSAADAYVPASDWASHQRIHQYSGDANLRYGGVTINVDGDYVDGATASTSSFVPDGTFVQISGSTTVYRIAGGAPMTVSGWTLFGGPQPVTTITEAQFSQLNRVPAVGTIVEGVPSHSYWQFEPGGRVPVAASSAAVTVEDAALTPYPVLGPSHSRCLVPALQRLTLAQARSRLAAAHCQLGTVRQLGGLGPHQPLRVSGQAPPARTSLPADYRVALTVR